MITQPNLTQPIQIIVIESTATSKPGLRWAGFLTTIIFDVTVATEMERSVSLPLGEIVLWQAANELLVRKEERKRERERERER